MGVREEFTALLEKDWADIPESSHYAKPVAQLEAEINAAAQPSGGVVIYGAGALGGLLAQFLRADYPELTLFFTDANSAKWGTLCQGVMVLPPNEVPVRARSMPVVIAVFFYFAQESTKREIDTLLASIGIETVIKKGLGNLLFLDILRRFKQKYMQSPEYQAMLLTVFDLFSDELSQKTWLAYFEMVVNCGSFELPVKKVSDQYFENELFEFLPNEHFVDCGAYNGDTLKQFLLRYPLFESYTAIEPDPLNAAVLQNYIQSIDKREKITVLRKATGRFTKMQNFFSTGTPGAHLTENGEIAVETVRLDDVVFETAPTFIKMDVEGAELDSLKGALRTIAAHRPILAVCIYHKPEDPAEIPLWLSQHVTGYWFYARKYITNPHELLLYAIPEERCILRQ